MSDEMRKALCDAIGIPFSKEQLDAITAPLTPGVIIAGAGTGKTAVMAARVVWLVAFTREVAPSEVLGLTFTRKAAAELAQRIDEALTKTGARQDSTDDGRETVSTYDAFAAGLVSEFGLRGGLEIEPRMITGASRYRLAESVVNSAAGPLKHLSRLRPQSIPERILELDSAMQSHLVDVESAEAFNIEARAGFASAPGKGKANTPYAGMLQAVAACEERQELLAFVDAYQKLKQERGVVEFGDQLRTAEHLVRTVPSIREAMRRRHKVVLLDEYQDTSSAQAKLLTGLFKHHPVTAVGDPYQAIYGWRGAAAQNILDFGRDFADGKATQYTLTVNRRSGQGILDVGNAIVAMMEKGQAEAEDTPEVGPTTLKLQAPEGKPVGTVEAAQFDTEDEEIEFLLTQIHDIGQASAWREIAVLCRVNATMGPVFEALRERGIPVEIVGLEGLLSLPEIVPVVATLRVVSDPTANASLATLLTSSRWGIGLADMAVLGRHAAASGADHPGEEAGLQGALDAVVAGSDPGLAPSLLEAIFDPPQGVTQEGLDRLREFAKEMQWLIGHSSEPILDLTQRVIRVLGIEEELLARGRDTSQLAKFMAECAAFVGTSGDTSLQGFLAHLDAEERHGVGLEQALVSNDDSVKLLSAHRAKGLEWDTVFLPSLSESVFPAAYRSGHWPHKAEALPAPLRGDADAVAQLEEYSEAGRKEYLEALKAEHLWSEDRLAYVAATRARSRLIATRHVWRAGRKTPLAASRYFDVIWTQAAEAGTAHDHLTGLEENPLGDRRVTAEWPATTNDHDDAQRHAAELVRSAQPVAEWVTASGGTPREVEEQFLRWDESMAHVIAARDRSRDRIIPLPRGLSATALIALRDDPQAFVESLLRPMPRKPSAHAHLGTQFHEWLERRFEAPLAFDELDSRPPALQKLIDAFERGQFSNRTPLAIEVPFSMTAGKFQLRGRIDAVYGWDGKEFDEVVIDWKTSDAPADVLQLAVYRRAWAESRGLAEARVGAAFYHVRSDRLVFADVDSELITSALSFQEASTHHAVATRITPVPDSR